MVLLRNLPPFTGLGRQGIGLFPHDRVKQVLAAVCCGTGCGWACGRQNDLTEHVPHGPIKWDEFLHEVYILPEVSTTDVKKTHATHNTYASNLRPKGVNES